MQLSNGSNSTSYEIGAGNHPNAIDDGLVVQLYEGTCAARISGHLFVNLDPFTVHTVNHVRYGTLFQLFNCDTLSPRMVELPKPEFAFGEWTLNLEVAGLKYHGAGAWRRQPVCAGVTDESGLSAGCFTITTSIVGSQRSNQAHLPLL